MLQWIMEEAACRTDTDEEIVTRIFLVNYAFVHTFTIVSIPVTSSSIY